MPENCSARKRLFPGVTLLITHYNRSKSLENLLNVFSLLGCKFEQIVVSDDGSSGEHINYVRKLKERYLFDLITSSSNRGLGHNINKGQDSVTSGFTLYVQEDFEPTVFFPDELENALTYMREDPKLDMVRFYAYFAYPYLKPFRENFSRISYRPFAKDYNKIYCYSDHPHLRRSSFFERFGRYVENAKGDRTEYKMCLSFIKEDGRALFYNDFQRLFRQVNSIHEPSTMVRKKWTQSRNQIISFVRDLYRQVRYNLDIARAAFSRKKTVL